MRIYLLPGGRIFFVFLVTIVTIMPCAAGNDTIIIAGIDKQRLGYTLAASAIGYTGVMLLLNEAWYKDFPRSSFQLYNDWGEWHNMDKTGHAFSSYTLSLAGINLMKQSGIPDKKAIWAGGLYGPIFLSTIEILDGFSERWGFSIPDMAANIAGSGLAVSQELVWGKQIARLKYSYHESGLALYRPGALGTNLPGKMLKDYNGQTHWISVSIGPLAKDPEWLPSWLSVALGYSADGLLGGFSNPETANGLQLPELKRIRQFYISPDIDLSAIDSGSEAINRILRSINFLKIPAPALELNSEGEIKLYLLFF
jgi:uncharacterized protein YfiM (DUF2279 family)